MHRVTAKIKKDTGGLNLGQLKVASVIPLFLIAAILNKYQVPFNTISVTVSEWLLEETQYKIK